MKDKKREEKKQEFQEKKREEKRLERKEMKDEFKIIKRMRSAEFKPIQSKKEFLPKLNQPCLCGSEKKFKKCCYEKIRSGEIKLQIEEEK